MSKRHRLDTLPILAFMIVIVFTVASCSRQELQRDAHSSQSVQAASERPSLPTMLELGSEGCIPCEKMKPVMAQLTEEHGELIHIEFHDVKKNQAIAKEYSIRLIPTQVFLKADGEEFFRHEGYFPKEEIEKVFRDMGVAL
ncbi:thioredoxin family protein [bacterium]|nr:thioredoxin family protein [bacterium]